MPEQDIIIQDPFEHIIEDHRKVRALMEAVSDASTDDLALKEEFFSQIRDALIVHTELEEQTLYPMLRGLEETQDLVDEAVEDHNEVKQLLQELSAAPKDTEEWDDRFEELRDSVEAHVQEEEADMLPQAKLSLSEAQTEEIRMGMETFLNQQNTATASL